MIQAKDAIEAARSLIGTPYSELDCINLIKKIIRISPGGDRKYTDAHVPALWASYNSSGKYKHLIWRQTGIEGAKPGMLAFKGKPLGRDHQPSHVGIVSGPNSVIHSSSQYGGVVETELNNGQWTLLAQHKLIGVMDDQEEDEKMEEVLYTARVVTAGGRLNLRKGRTTSSPSIRLIDNGETVDVYDDSQIWWKIGYGGCEGYSLSSFLEPIKGEDPLPEPVPGDPDTDQKDGSQEWMEDPWFVSEEGAIIQLHGRWRMCED